MQIIDLEKPCSKCGSRNILHKYRQAGERLDDKWLHYEKAECKLIRSYCRVCGYRWNSLPKDSQEEWINSEVYHFLSQYKLPGINWRGFLKKPFLESLFTDLASFREFLYTDYHLSNCSSDAMKVRLRKLLG